MNSFGGYLQAHYGEILQYTFEHLRIGLLAVSVSILIGIPLGLLITKFTRGTKIVLGTASFVQAIPSLALIGLLIPLIGIGDKTAIVVIAVYAILPILRNTYTGLTNIDDSTIEAAKGIGMMDRQILFRVQFPMALPVIMAGVRVSAVNSVATATLAAFAGGGGLGKLIQGGLQVVNINMILSGAIPACLLALLIDFIFARVEKAVVPISLSLTAENIDANEIAKMKHSQKRTVVAACLILALMIGTAVYDSVEWNKKDNLIIGTTGYMELRVTSELYGQMMEYYCPDINVVHSDAMVASWLYGKL